MDGLGGKVAAEALVRRRRQGQVDPVGGCHAFESGGFGLHRRHGVLQGFGDLFVEVGRFTFLDESGPGERQYFREQSLRCGGPERPERLQRSEQYRLEVLDVLPLVVLTRLLLGILEFRFRHVVDEGHGLVEVLRHAQLAQGVHQLVHLEHVRARHELRQQIGLQQGLAEETVLPSRD